MGGKASVRHTEGLLESQWYTGCAGGQDLRGDNKLPWEQKKLACISPFQDYPINSKNFYLIWCYSSVSQISNKFLKQDFEFLVQMHKSLMTVK